MSKRTIHPYEIEAAFASNGDPDYPEIPAVHPSVHAEVMKHLGDHLAGGSELLPKEKDSDTAHFDENWNHLHSKADAVEAAYQAMKKGGYESHPMASHLDNVQRGIYHSLKRLISNQHNDSNHHRQDFYPESVSLDEIKMIVEEFEA